MSRPLLELDPFAVLGLSKGATPACIRGAYRKLATQYHPDKNPGDPEALARYKRVVTAYEALTGRKAPDNANAEAAGVLAQCLQVVLATLTEKGQDVSQHDLVAYLRQCLDENLGEMRKQKDIAVRQIEALEDVVDRWEHDGGDTLLADLAQSNLDVLRAHNDKLTRKLDLYRRAKELLKGYRYRHHRPRPATTAGAASGTSAVNGYVVFNNI
jgi:hypothetical protein